MAGLALSGLASGFDWKGIVDQLIEVSRAPQKRMQREKAELSTRTNALNEVRSAVSTLKSSVGALGTEAALLKKAASIANPDTKWKAAAGTNATQGEYSFEIVQTATTSVVRGQNGIGKNTPSGNTLLSEVPLGRPIRSGTFTVNGAVINVDITVDTYNSIAQKITSATAGHTNKLTAAYNAGVDKFEIASASSQSILLGSASDTSNFLEAMSLVSATFVGEQRVGGRDLTQSPVITAGSFLSGAGVTDGWVSLNGVNFYVEPSVGETLTNVLGYLRTAPGIVSANISGNRLTFDSTVPLTFGQPDPAPNGDPVSNFFHVLGLIESGENTHPSAPAIVDLPTTLAGGSSSGFASSSALGKVNLNTPISSVSTNLGSTLGSATTGSFYVNGAEIAYDTNVDTIQIVLDRITSSAAGVIASYDPSGDAVILTNKVTGNIATFVTTDDQTSAGRPGRDDAGLVVALFGPAPDPGGDTQLFTPDDINTGLDGVSGTPDDIVPFFATLTRVGPVARDAIFRVNNGGEINSRSNIFNETVHGIRGLTIDATSQGSIDKAAGDTPVTEKITIKGDSSAAKEAVNDFISKYNALQSVIEKHTKVTYADGKVTAGVLAGSRELADISRSLRQSLFRDALGSGSIRRLADLGVSTSGIESTLSLSNAALLESQINTEGAAVLDFFTRSSSGLIPRLNALLGDSSTDVSAASGKIGIQLTSIQKQNTSLDKQIADLERRLESQRQLMESSFIAMERAQSKFQQQSSYLQRTFASNNK